MEIIIKFRKRIEYLTNIGTILLILALIILGIMGTIDSTGKAHGTKIPVVSNIYTQCYVRENYGVDCVTCGMSRSFYSFFEGKFAQAMEYNYLVIPVIVVFILLIGNSGYFLTKGCYNPKIMKVLYIAIGILVTVYIIRFFTLMIGYLTVGADFTI